ncbi:unnamed protein product, partial [Laminaria digitata]
GEVRDCSGIPTPKRVCESTASGTDMLEAIKPHAFHSPPRSHHPGGEGHGEVRDGGGISTPKRVCESVADGTDMLQVENPHAYDSPPRSHQPGGSRRGYDQDCSRSPELVMVWDDGEPPDEDQVLEAAPADQAQELQGRRHLRGARSTSPSSAINLALDSDSYQQEHAPQEGQVAANVLQRPASPQILPAAAVKGAQRVDEQTRLHGGALSPSASKLTQKHIEGDRAETTRRTAGVGSRKEAEQSQTKDGDLALLPACALDPSGGGREDKG